MPRHDDEALYEVHVNIHQIRQTTLVVHLRAGSEQEASRRAEEAAQEACDKAQWESDIDGEDFDFVEYTCEGVEDVYEVEQGKKPQWSPNIDLMDSPTDAEIAGSQEDPRQTKLPFD